MELLLSNISSYNISNITSSSYYFSNLTAGDPYRVVGEVYDNLNFQHILTNVVLGDGYIWPVDDISDLDFTIEMKEDISFQIKKEYIRPDEIPVFIHCNILDPIVTNYTIQFDLYAEPLIELTYKPHTKKRYVTNEINEIADNYIKYYLNDLDMLIPYDIYYSLKIKPPDINEWKYVTTHSLIDTNVMTTNPGMRVDLSIPDRMPINAIYITRTVSGYFFYRTLSYHVREHRVEDLYDNMRSSPKISNVNILF